MQISKLIADMERKVQESHPEVREGNQGERTKHQIQEG